MKIITGKKVFLQNFEEIHMNSLEYLSWVSDKEVVKHIGRPEFENQITLEKIKSYFKNTKENLNIHFYALYKIENEKFIGTAKINFFDNTEIRKGIADIGIMIGEKNEWGCGLGSDTLLAISQYAFKCLDARKLTAGASIENIGVLKAFEKIGYKREGILRNQLYLSGRYIDHVLLGCLPSDLC